MNAVTIDGWRPGQAWEFEDDLEHTHPSTPGELATSEATTTDAGIRFSDGSAAVLTATGQLTSKLTAEQVAERQLDLRRNSGLLSDHFWVVRHTTLAGES